MPKRQRLIIAFNATKPREQDCYMIQLVNNLFFTFDTLKDMQRHKLDDSFFYLLSLHLKNAFLVVLDAKAHSSIVTHQPNEPVHARNHHLMQDNNYYRVILLDGEEFSGQLQDSDDYSFAHKTPEFDAHREVG